MPTCGVSYSANSVLRDQASKAMKPFELFEVEVWLGVPPNGHLVRVNVGEIVMINPVTVFHEKVSRSSLGHYLNFRVSVL